MCSDKPQIKKSPHVDRKYPKGLHATANHPVALQKCHIPQNATGHAGWIS